MHTIIGKEEKAYLDCMKRHKDQGVHAHFNSPQEGLYFLKAHGNNDENPNLPDP